MAQRKSIVKWLLAGDPAIAWQVLRDLEPAPAGEVAAARARVATDGWGAALLALQAPGGHWGPPDDDGWMTTVDALDLLRLLGVDPAGEPARRALSRVREQIRWWQLAGEPFFAGETEACINGRILAAGSYFGEDCEALAARLLSEQLEDGGWNCEAPASRRSSFHSTLCVLEGLLEYQRQNGAAPALTEAQQRGREYLMERRLLRSLSTGELLDRKWTRFSFPPVWHYDVLRALDYLRDAGVAPDPRLAEALAVVEDRRHQNGRWPMNLLHHDRIGFPLEPAVGSASRWNTLRALRVLEAYGSLAERRV